MQPPRILRKIAGIISSSFLFTKGRKLWETNSKDWKLPLSKWDKLMCGSYIILHDFAAGIFPPKFTDQAEAYQNEIDLDISLPGMDFAEVQRFGVTKPFWTAATTKKHLDSFSRAFITLEQRGVVPGQRLLELGCGCGWMAEFFAIAGYSVAGTTISPRDVELAKKKLQDHRWKELKSKLEFYECAMEAIDTIAEFQGAFDAAYVYEALHHAYDWRKTIHAVTSTLKPRGWLLLADEPNRMHTYISYRVAKLSHTHEIGFQKKDLVSELYSAGFDSVEVLRPRFDDWFSPFWILARKA